MISSRKLKIFLSCFCLVTIVVGCLGIHTIGSALIAPAHRVIPPAETGIFHNVEFESLSGARIRGWYGQHEKAIASVMLLHGVRSDRREMRERAEFLYQQGLNVLLFDFQAHGESEGESITFGYREARDAEAAFLFLKTQADDLPVGALGFSLGGAAILLGHVESSLDFLILEAVYPDIETAIKNRLTMRLGKFGALLTPLLSWQLNRRLGIRAEQLRPLSRLRAFRCPVLVIGGSEDQRTTLADTERLFHAAAQPKELWIVQGASHENFHTFAPDEYERRIAAFIRQALQVRKSSLPQAQRNACPVPQRV